MAPSLQRRNSWPPWQELYQPRVGVDAGLKKLRCPVSEVPTDEEAREAGFESAKEWWIYSLGASMTPAAAEMAWCTLVKLGEG